MASGMSGNIHWNLYGHETRIPRGPQIHLHPRRGCPHPMQTLLGDAPRGIKEDFSSLEEVGGDGGDGGGPPQPLFPTEKKMKEKLKKKKHRKNLDFSNLQREVTGMGDT